ncbi:MAG: alanine--tRNA ligase [Chloroflexi bacterium]|nr:MAG: alanine--tRNA ligase [Chloroflexota bacterium]
MPTSSRRSRTTCRSRLRSRDASSSTRQSGSGTSPALVSARPKPARAPAKVVLPPRSAEIRERFIKFFEEKGHTRMPSWPLILKDDPSVLFTSAGMQPLVPYFLGKKQPPAKRIVAVQKVFRATDIEEVGRDGYHQTFWEMLGNFGIGDYWKKEAIEWGWELLTKVFGVDGAKLVATVHHTDEEAYQIWTKTLALLPPDKVFRLGDEANFWAPGPTGLCGPDSEVFIDKGPQPGVGAHDCNPGENCGRYVEIWNFVFQQYDRKADGTLVPLAKKNIDTGAGLERITQVLQGVPGDVYRTDLFQPLVRKIESLSGKKYGAEGDTDLSIRIVAEHSRAATFLIADGVVPSNEFRGYVLRRLIRRAALHGRRLGLKTGVLATLGGEVVKTMQKHYHELTKGRDRITQVISDEEEKFEKTLANGLTMLNEAIARAKAEGQTWIDSDTAFRLSDTYGFPLEMTKEIAASSGLKVDERGFAELLEGQRSRSRATAKFTQDAMRFGQFYSGLRETQGLRSQFTGYDELATDAMIVSLVVGGSRVEAAHEGQDVEIVLDRTPFYPEGGGQVGDRGTITTDEGRAMVADTQTAAPGVIVMSAKVVDGVLRVSAQARAAVDEELRRDTMRNHTATHLLHATLRNLFGEDVHQAGSLVHAPNLRFDFTFDRALTPQELQRVEDEVNRAILDNASVHARVMPLSEALATGAMALFGEKYDDEVRVIEAGPSRELCGGTHCHCTGDIGPFLVTKEESIGAGVRRIEAVTGVGALREMREVRDRLSRAAAALRVPPARVPESVGQLIESRERLEKELATLQRSGVDSVAATLLAKAELVGNAKLVAADVGDGDVNQLRALSDRIRETIGSGVVVLGARRNGTAALVVNVTKDLSARVNADALVKVLARIVDGRGGGRPESATGGGKDPSRLAEMLETARETVRERLDGGRDRR